MKPLAPHRQFPQEREKMFEFFIALRVLPPAIWTLDAYLSKLSAPTTVPALNETTIDLRLNLFVLALRLIFLLCRTVLLVSDKIIHCSNVIFCERLLAYL